LVFLRYLHHYFKIVCPPKELISPHLLRCRAFAVARGSLSRFPSGAARPASCICGKLDACKAGVNIQFSYPYILQVISKIQITSKDKARADPPSPVYKAMARQAKKRSIHARM